MKYLVKPLCFFGLGILVLGTWWWQHGAAYPWHNLGWLLRRGDQATTNDPWTKEQIETALKNSDLTTKERIRDWLKDMSSEGWKSFTAPVSWGKPLDEDTQAFLNASRSGVEPTKVSSYAKVSGIRGETTVVSLKQIDIFFYFDKDGQLLNYCLEERTLMP